MNTNRAVVIATFSYATDKDIEPTKMLTLN